MAGLRNPSVGLTSAHVSTHPKGSFHHLNGGPHVLRTFRPTLRDRHQNTSAGSTFFTLPRANNPDATHMTTVKASTSEARPGVNASGIDEISVRYAYAPKVTTMPGMNPASARIKD